MASLSDFVKKFDKDKKVETTQELKEKAEQMRDEIYKEKGDEFNNLLSGAQERFKDMDQGQLYSELFKEAGRLKSSGQFNYEALSSAIENMSSYITPEQKQTMLNLLKQLK
jgi:hypothetical protein